jgi:predicted flap endonuclease-1-like 5' DNA nuclease
VSGVEEEAAEFRRPIDFQSNDRFRRIAGIGPVYEALEDKGAFVRVRIVDTDEAFDYRKDDAELDPAP